MNTYQRLVLLFNTILSYYIPSAANQSFEKRKKPTKKSIITSPDTRLRCLTEQSFLLFNLYNWEVCVSAVHIFILRL